MVTNTNQTSAQRRDCYLQLMHKAQQLNDQGLICLIAKKMAGLGKLNTLSSAGDCHVIPFPPIFMREVNQEPEPPLWWVLIKLTLLIPGSLTLLLILSMYTDYSGWVLSK